jgi:hypothetical protein
MIKLKKKNVEKKFQPKIWKEVKGGGVKGLIMIPFRNYFLLTERVEKTDIIDLYVMMAMGPPEDPAYLDIYNQKFLEASQHIKDEIEHILLREVRHVLSKTTEMSKLLNDFRSQTSDIIKRYELITSLLNYNSVSTEQAAREFVYSLEKLKSMFTYGEHQKEVTFKKATRETGISWNINLVYNMFNNLIWYIDYGGKAWAQITQEAAKVLTENNVTQLVSSVDRFIDYVHNTGSILNKFAGSYDGWFNFILDLKAQSQNIRELMPFTSYEIRSMMRDPAWRLGMFQQPGIGADKSDKVIENLLFKYFVMFVNDFSIYDAEWLSIDEVQTDHMGEYAGGVSDHPHIKMANILDKFGIDRTINAINNSSQKYSRIKNARDELIKIYNDAIDNKSLAVSKKQKEFLDRLAGSNNNDSI